MCVWKGIHLITSNVVFVLKASCVWLYLISLKFKSEISALCLSQGLFYRVVGGEVSPFRLVRLSAEELLSKEISEWRKPDPSEVKLTFLQLQCNDV